MLDEDKIRESTVTPDFKATYPPGPWHDEPDCLVYKDGELDCVIRRIESGILCGYVMLEDEHQWALEKTYWDIEVEVHGGITFLERPHWGDGRYAVGFDCGHASDHGPMYYKEKGYTEDISHPHFLGGDYRSVEYVKEEVARLAQQVRRAAPSFFALRDEHIKSLQDAVEMLAPGVYQEGLRNPISDKVAHVKNTVVRLTGGETAPTMLHLAQVEELEEIWAQIRTYPESHLVSTVRAALQRILEQAS